MVRSLASEAFEFCSELGVVGHDNERYLTRGGGDKYLALIHKEAPASLARPGAMAQGVVAP
jgi:hypothetical protein